MSFNINKDRVDKIVRKKPKARTVIKKKEPDLGKLQSSQNKIVNDLATSAPKNTNTINTKDYFKIGYEHGKNLGYELGRKEIENCLAQFREPQNLKEIWPSLSKKAMDLHLGNVLNKIKKGSKEERLKSIEYHTILLKNEGYQKGLANGLAYGYQSRTKDGLYNGIFNKGTIQLSDWEQGYIAGHDYAKPIGRSDKIKGNPKNWFARYREVNFRYLESDDSQYLDGFCKGFKSGYISGYSIHK